MRRAFLLVSLAAAAVAGIAATAGARTETRFAVLEIHGSVHRSGRSFIGRNLLAQPGHPHAVVGHDVFKITPNGAKPIRIRGVAHIQGEGSLKVKGASRELPDNRIPIIGGTGEFNGAAGKLKVRVLSHTRELLKFIFVQ